MVFVGLSPNKNLRDAAEKFGSGCPLQGKGGCPEPVWHLIPPGDAYETEGILNQAEK
jgi:hypothetical protein